MKKDKSPYDGTKEKMHTALQGKHSISASTRAMAPEKYHKLLSVKLIYL